VAEGESKPRAGGGDRRLHRAAPLTAIFGSLVLAVRESKGWRYVGRAGTGFDHEMLRDLHAKLVPLITDAKPVSEKLPDAANTTWVRPKLVAEVKFTEWTSKGEMRHPVFLGLRTDKKPTDAVMEKPQREAGRALSSN
jgi:bifunctional non-homologous end joining protein LigD